MTAKRLFISGLLLFALFIVLWTVYDQIHPPTQCDHGESSISGHFDKHHKFIIDQPATKTGC